MTDPTAHLFWITSWDAGTTAVLLSSVTVGSGLAMSGKLGKLRAVDRRSFPRTLATSIGVVAGWGMIVLGLSYYARRRIGITRWRVIHRFTLLVWLGGLVHAFTEGTDAGSAWFILLILAAAAPTVALLVARVARPGRRSDAIMRAWKRKSSSGSPATRPSSAR